LNTTEDILKNVGKQTVDVG